jgi:hypothetical protein
VQLPLVRLYRCRLEGMAVWYYICKRAMLGMWSRQRGKLILLSNTWILMRHVQDSFLDELGQRTMMVHDSRQGANCEYAETLRCIAWLIYSQPELRVAFEASVWRNGQGLDSNPAVPFVRWVAQKNPQTMRPNIYSVGWFALSI